MAFSYAGTGRLFPFRSEDLIGILSYSYNPSIGDPFYYLDFGSVADPTIDSWVIANHANVTIQSIANDRIVDLVYSGGTTGNYIDHGLVSEIEAVTQDDWGLITVSSDIFSFGTFKLSSLATWSVHKVWVGTGQIWERGRAITRLIAPYHASGTLRVSGAAGTFYVPSIATDGVLPLRSFTTINTLKHQLGSGSLKKFEVEFIGEKTIEIHGKEFLSQHFRLTGEFEREIWYDVNDVLVRAQFEASDGSTVEYVLK